MNIPHVSIEKTFDSIISACGGVRVTDLVGSSPNFSNADYLFHGEKIVAELKCLEIDKTHDPTSPRKLDRAWIKWRQRGLVSGHAPPTIDSRTLPKVCQDEMYKIIGEPVRRRIQKANRQIRETKAALDIASYSGLLLIANDGNFAFSPAALVHYVQTVLRKEFREIENFIFFTANMHSRMTGIPTPALFWIAFSMTGGRPLTQGFVDRLHHAWVEKHQELTGIPGVEGEIEDMEAFWNASYRR